MRTVKKIIIHCAYTPNGMDIGADEIRRWHTAKRPEGNGWSRLGYHWVIRRNGTVERGTDESISGIHVAGHNLDSIGVCMVGGKPNANFTRWQWAALEAKIAELTRTYPDAEVCGHNEFDTGKTCPQFDAKAWWYGDRQ